MELWWWVEPLGYTGIVCALLAFIVMMVFREVEHWWPVAVIFVLLLPLIISGLSTVLWFICYAFWSIWSPYF